jgi:hypothetical protein
MTCWNVGRFVQRIVSGSTPDVKRIRSAVASARQAEGMGPCDASRDAAAVSIATHKDSRQVWSTPPPQ